MKDRDPALLSFEQIETSDLQRLLKLARADRDDFFRRHPDWAKIYAHRILGTALCQGGALHYLDPTHGLNDFDVYTFYAAAPERRWYSKRNRHVDFGESKFGCSQISKAGFIGRRVDLMGRELPVNVGDPLDDSLRLYLAARKTRTACELASKAVVILEPEEQMGKVLWTA